MSVQQFIDGFLGYGSLGAPVWFLGLEEGGGKSVEELLRRIEIWRQLGAAPAVDLFEFHRELQRDEFFGPNPKRQATWARISQMMLAAEGTPPAREAVLSYQSERLGRKEGVTFLTELLPLPKPALREWHYCALASEIPCLRRRADYLRTILPKRRETLKRAVRTHRPVVVVFYGMSYRRHWRLIAGVDFETTDCNSLHGRDDTTDYLMVAHPNARGLDADYFTRQGEVLRECWSRRRKLSTTQRS